MKQNDISHLNNISEFLYSLKMVYKISISDMFISFTCKDFNLKIQLGRAYYLLNFFDTSGYTEYSITTIDFKRFDSLMNHLKEVFI